MKKDQFSELLASIKEAGEIMKGQKKPSRLFTFEKPKNKVNKQK